MANVKFYRLGKEGPVDFSVYNEYKQGDASNGGIIFANVKDPDDPSKTLQYIWANGIEYNVGQGSSNVHIDVSTVIPEEAGLTPSHGDYYIREEVITEKLGAEPRRTAYIFDSTVEENGKWVVLDGNVDATNVFFKDGIDRTAAIGVLPATIGGKIENEGKAMNLKELLEYYLVQETYPNVTATTASANASSYSIALSKPNNISTYMSSTASLVEVGTQITFNGIDLVENASHNGKTTYTSSISEIKGMAFGATTSFPGEVSTNIKNASAGPITTSASYVNNFDSAMATISLTKNSGFDGITTTTNSAGIDGSTLSLSSATGTIVEGENKLTLNWSSDASVNRTITKDETIPAMEYYYASNKGNTSTNKKASTATVSWVDNNPTATVANTSSSITITGVYPIYANASIGAASGTDESFVWHNWSMEPKEKLPLRCVSDTTGNLYFYVGNNSGGDASKKLGVYIPKQLKIQVSSTNIQVPDVDAQHNYTSDSFGLISGVLYETIDTSINSVPYTLYELSGIGATCFKLTLENKN